MLMDEYDYDMDIAVKQEEACEEALEEGEKIGKAQKAREVAFRLAQKGMEVSDIADIVAVSPNLVREWLSGSESEEIRADFEFL